MAEIFGFHRAGRLFKSPSEIFPTRQPQAVVIMITANVLVEDTLAALRGGAYDFSSTRGQAMFVNCAMLLSA